MDKFKLYAKNNLDYDIKPLNKKKDVSVINYTDKLISKNNKSTINLNNKLSNNKVVSKKRYDSSDEESINNNIIRINSSKSKSKSNSKSNSVLNSNYNSGSNTDNEINEILNIKNEFNTIYRDKSGKIVSKDELNKEETLKKLLIEKNEKYIQLWSRGAKQVEDMINKKLIYEEGNTNKLYNNNIQESKYQICKDKINNNNDDDNYYEEYLKNKISKDDPLYTMKKLDLLEYSPKNKTNNINSKNNKYNYNKFNEYESQRIKNDLKNSVSFTLGKKCPFEGIPNRFNIKPGYMWDGVDRSNGYENRLLKAINEKNDLDYLNFKFRTEDM